MSERVDIFTAREAHKRRHDSVSDWEQFCTYAEGVFPKLLDEIEELRNQLNEQEQQFDKALNEAVYDAKEQGFQAGKKGGCY